MKASLRVHPPSKTLEATLLLRLRKVCLALPEVVETIKWGHPTFEIGKKAFAVLDHYHGAPCIAFLAAKEQQRNLSRDKRFFTAPYAAKHGWFCLSAETKLHWLEIRHLILASYRLAAPKQAFSANSSAVQNRPKTF